MPVPPQNLAAEDAVLGALIYAGGALGAETAAHTLALARGEGLESACFYRKKRAGAVFEAIVAVVERGDAPDGLTVCAELEIREQLEDVGGEARIAELAALATAPAAVASHARLIVDAARRREMAALGAALTATAHDMSASLDDELGARLRALIERPTAPGATHDRFVDGATFVFSEPETTPAVWGSGERIAWAAGEGLMLVGPEGVGKTTLGQQILLARIGLRPGPLDMSITPTSGRVLAIVADRPRQWARSLRRMVGPDDEEVLRERLIVWRGPLPFDITKDPRQLAAFARSRGGVDTLVIDALKDVATSLSDDEVGGRVNLAFQEVIASEIELLAQHHQRKAQHGAQPKTLDDVYGSRWLTAGMGSVVLLWGEPGDPVVELRHLKQPAAEIGPLKLMHDHRAGATTLYETPTLDAALAEAPEGLTAADAARVLFDAGAKPANAKVEKARRRLEDLVAAGHAERRADGTGAVRYFPRGEKVA